jgi:hypothetical protein
VRAGDGDRQASGGGSVCLIARSRLGPGDKQAVAAGVGHCSDGDDVRRGQAAAFGM